MLTSDSNPKEEAAPAATEPAAPPRPPWTARLFALLLTVVAATGYASISLYRHDHYASNAFDLAIQDQTVWGYSRFEFIYNTVEGIPNLLADHFHPILMVLAPFMWIWNSVAVLLVAQAVLLALAGLPIYFWGERVLSPVGGLLFQAAYLCFWGVFAGVVYDFHHVVFAVPAISLALYATLTRRNVLLYPAVVAAMLTREDVALTLIALGFYILVVQRRWILGAAMMAVFAAWFALLLGVVMPALGGGVAYRHWTYDALGKNPAAALRYVVTHPIQSVRLLFDPATKTRVWIGSFAAFALLPLVSPLLLVALPSFLERFWSFEPNFWSFHFQYSMLPAPILTFAAMDTCARIKHLRGGWAGIAASKILPALALAAGVVVTVAVNPVAELATYLPASRVAQINACLATIPADASVSASNALVPHLSHRDAIYEIEYNSSADYIAIDPSTYGDFYAGEEEKLRNDVRGALAAGYSVVCAQGTTLVLARIDSTKQLTPELQRWLAEKCSGRGCAAS